MRKTPRGWIQIGESRTRGVARIPLGLKPSRDSRATSQRDSPIWIQPLGVFRYKRIWIRSYKAKWKITFIFGRCHRSLAAGASVKYGCDFTNLTFTFAKLTNGASITPPRIRCVDVMNTVINVLFFFSNIFSFFSSLCFLFVFLFGTPSSWSLGRQVDHFGSCRLWVWSTSPDLPPLLGGRG